MYVCGKIMGEIADGRMCKWRWNNIEWNCFYIIKSNRKVVLSSQNDMIDWFLVVELIVPLLCMNGCLWSNKLFCFVDSGWNWYSNTHT